MKLENQVCSLDLAKRLKELGVRQESIFYWAPGAEIEIDDIVRYENWHVQFNKGFQPDYSAFTVAELGEILQHKTFNTHSFKTLYGNDWCCYLERENGGYHKVYDTTEADARAKMLIYLLENNLIDRATLQ